MLRARGECRVRTLAAPQQQPRRLVTAQHGTYNANAIRYGHTVIALRAAAGAAAAAASDAADADATTFSSTEPRELVIPDFDVPDAVRARNAALVARLRGKLVLAPLTRGGHLPFRRLCRHYAGDDGGGGDGAGALPTVSEMVFARELVRGTPKEKALLRRGAGEELFGVQIATKVISEGVKAAAAAADAGAAWVDLNCGCPIHEATRRGLGAALLGRPTKLARLVNGIVLESGLPVTVKIRTGVQESKINAEYVTRLLGAAGAAAVTVHGRTMEQRYKKAADWGVIADIAERTGVPVIGNGDILTHYEAADRWAAGRGAFTAMMVGRGALVKPWLFEEVRAGRELCLDARQRVGEYRLLVSFMREHFGDDDKGRRKAMYFLPWHFDFFARYRHYPEADFLAASRAHPLLATRDGAADAALERAELDALPPLERLLRCEAAAAHAVIADALWDAGSDADAAATLERVAATRGQLEEWEAEARGGGRREGRTVEG